MEPRLVATLVTSQALNDFKVFVKTLSLWHAPTHTYPTLVLFLDSTIQKEFQAHFSYPGKVHIQTCLDKYSFKTRSEMERLPSDTQATLWMEFQMEKLNLLKWAFEVEPETAANQGVFYLDSDICFLAPLPVPPEDPSIEVGLSPHYIRKHDEERFGRYNAGYVWMRSVDAVEAWRAACADSTFFEQAALEVFDTDTRWASKRYIFPIQHNYGWWRMWQSERSPTDCLKEWGIFRTQSSSGIVVQGKPLASVHTHWVTNDSATAQFNKIVYEFLKRLASAHPPAAHLLKSLPSPHQKLKG